MITVILLALGLSGAGIYTLIRGSKEFIKYKLITTVPLRKISEIKENYTHIKGKVVGKNSIKVPFSNVNCVYFKYDIEVMGTLSFTSRHSWDVMYSYQSKNEFYIDDGSKKILIDPLNIDANLTFKKIYKLTSRIKEDVDLLKNELTNIINNPIKSLDITEYKLELKNERESDLLRRVNDKRLKEYYIQEGDEIEIYGNFEKNTIKNNKYMFMFDELYGEITAKLLKYKFIFDFVIGLAMFISSMILIYIATNPPIL
ncbi:MAG: hypothetical protein AB7V77_01445 [Candidatus Woesearchaeota archaeon]